MNTPKQQNENLPKVINGKQYVLVDIEEVPPGGKPMPDEKKPEVAKNTLKTVKAAMAKANSGKGKHNTTKFIVVTNSSAISGNATAQAPVFPVAPGTASEFANLAGLYDEYIVDAVECFFNCSTPNSQTGDVDFAFAYDPVNAGVYSSVLGVLEASQFKGPFQHGNTGKACTPVAMNTTGFYRWLVKMPKGPQIVNPNASASDVRTRAWPRGGALLFSHPPGDGAACVALFFSLAFFKRSIGGEKLIDHEAGTERLRRHCLLRKKGRGGNISLQASRRTRLVPRIRLHLCVQGHRGNATLASCLSRL